MNVAVIDVGSNTVRLLVARRSENGVACVTGGKCVVGLGADIERLGSVSAAKMTEAAECLRGLAEIARAVGSLALDVVVASPGRQAENSDLLVHTLSRAAGVPVRVLSRDEEARLAFDGALAASRSTGSVAVVDVGGGSTQIAVGTVSGGPAWLTSVDIGSLRLSARVACSDPPRKSELAALRAEAADALASVTPPLPKEAIAVGGTARALRRLVGRSLGPDELAQAQRLLRSAPAEAIADRYDVDLSRVRTLPGGAAILTQAQQLLGVPLEVGRGGLREGVALELLDRLPAVQAGGR
jgi:exopolyphosphatase / guanosine-5'-triphosphate,3'-diphosphate pyrophosphatase